MSYPDFARVVFNIPLFQAYEYRVPESLKEEATPGKRVLVFFRNSRKIGFIIETSNKLEHKGRISNILRVIDPVPLIDVTRLELSKKISSYYHCPQGIVLGAMLPAGFKFKGERSYLLSGKEIDCEISLEEKSILNSFHNHEEMSFSRIQKKFRGIFNRNQVQNFLDLLLKKGFLTKGGIIPAAGLKSKARVLFSLNSHNEQHLAIIKKIRPASIKVQILARLKGYSTVSKKELVSQWGSKVYAALKWLIQKDLIKKKLKKYTAVPAVANFTRGGMALHRENWF
ncbi:hypothetical protein ACFL35_01040 [Candidatus Riflebacteria bacterium]